jgi:hypothetical protein
MRGSLGLARRRARSLLPLLLGLAVTTFALIGFTAVTAAADQQISAKALQDHECDSTEWHFVINQINDESNAPGSIHVTCANGQEADVPGDKFTGGVAHYTTTLNLDSTVTSATATIYDAWDGQFNLSHGPCGPPTPSTPQVRLDRLVVRALPAREWPARNRPGRRRP